MNRHRRALQQIADARPAVLDGAPDRPAPHFPDAPAHFRRTPRPRQRLVLAGLVPTIAVAAIVIAVAVSTTGQRVTPQPPQTQAESPNARGILLAAAAQAATGTQPTAEWWVTKLEMRFRYNAGGYTVLARTENETWHSTRPGINDVSVTTKLGAAPETDADKAAWVKAGSPTTWQTFTPEGQPGRKIDAGPGPRKVDVVPPFGFALLGKDLTYAEVQALPADPARLKAYLVALDPQNVDSELLFSLGGQILTELPATPQVRAAVYRILAELPGLTITQGERDAKGRIGVGVKHSFRNADGTTHDSMMIIDRQSGDLLATVHEQGTTLRLGNRFTDETPPTA